jgi:hypothetical protein
MGAGAKAASPESFVVLAGQGWPAAFFNSEAAAPESNSGI